jgi:hypothetical protein
MSAPVDLIAEYKAAIAAVTPAYRKRLGELGLIAPANRIGLVGVAGVRDIGRGLYEPDDGFLPAVLLPVWDGPIGDATAFLSEPDRLVDLVAWRPKEGAQFLTRLGLAVTLGAEAIRAALLSGEPLRLFRDPGGWARAGGGDAGAVVIEWSEEAGLLGLKSIVADDIEHGAEVKKRLKALRARLIGRVPQIRVPVKREAAA